MYFFTGYSLHLAVEAPGSICPTLLSEAFSCKQLPTNKTVKTLLQVSTNSFTFHYVK